MSSSQPSTLDSNALSDQVAAQSARPVGTTLLGFLVAVTIAAPVIAPNSSGEQFRDLLYAPPMRVHVIDEAGAVRRPFVYPLRLADRLEQRYEEDRTRLIPLVWGARGKLLGLEAGPLLLLGADSLGRDILSRLLEGARVSIGLAVISALGALFLGTLLGAAAGYLGGVVDEILTRLGDFVLVLPAIYVVLALRAAMPLVLPGSTLFILMSGLLALVGWPYVARGVRAIVAAESQREYAAAAESLGAGHLRILFRHLLPSARGFLLVQATLFLPAFILAEATMSYIGLGFAEPTPSWGSMLKEAANIAALAQFPWLLAPAAAITLTVLAVNLALPSDHRVNALRFAVPDRLEPPHRPTRPPSPAMAGRLTASAGSPQNGP